MGKGMKIAMFIVTVLMFISTVSMVYVGLEALNISRVSLIQSKHIYNLSELMFEYEKKKAEPNIILKYAECPLILNAYVGNFLEIHNGGELPAQYSLYINSEGINCRIIKDKKVEKYLDEQIDNGEYEKILERYDYHINYGHLCYYHSWIEGKETYKPIFLLYAFKDVKDNASLKVNLYYNNKSINLFNCDYTIERDKIPIGEKEIEAIGYNPIYFHNETPKDE
jgi:hypothetical protein